MKNMKRRMISKLAVLLAAVFCFSAAWVNASSLYLYQPKFAGNGTSSNSLGLTGATSNLLSVAGWNCHYTTNGTAQPTTQGQNNEFVQTASSLLTTISANTSMQNQKALLWTENFAVTNIDVSQLTEVMFYQQNGSNTTVSRLALRVGGSWYASVNVYSNTTSTKDQLLRTTVTATDLAAMSFYSLDFVAGSRLLLGSSPVAFADLSGAVNAAGLYYNTLGKGSSNNDRLREFTVATSIYGLTVNGGSGSGSYFPGTQVAITASNSPGRTFAAWIGDTQGVDNVTSANTTVTMSTNEVTQLTATYDKASLTANSGTGGGLYTSGANVAITASNIPGKFFLAWIGDTQYVASATSATTTVTVPVQDIVLTAKYTLLYQPNVAGNSNSNSLGHGGVTTNYLLSNVSWKAHYTVNGTAQSTTQGQTNEFVQSSPALLTQCVVGNVMRNQKAILWTENFWVTNASVQSLSEVMFYQQNMDTNTMPRLALRVGGNWYASVATYPNMVANAMERTTLTNANLAAMTFYSLAFTPGSSLVLDTGSNTAFSALSGVVNAAGLYYDETGTNYVRLREFTVSTAASTLKITGGSGSGSYNPGEQVAISANTTTSRTFVAWIGDTQCVDNVTSANATVTMLSSTVSLTATYDKTSLTVTNGTGNGLYTSGQQVAITAHIPGMIFVAWTGATQYVASVTSATTTVTIPVQDIALTATYTGAILYQPNFAGNSNSNSLGHGGVTTNYLLSNVSWKANYSVNGTVQSTTQGQTNEFVQTAASVLTECSKTGNVMRDTNALLWTENFATNNVAVQNLAEVMFYLQNMDTNTIPRLALRVGGNWYASVATYPNKVANAMERTTLLATDLAAMSWHPLAFTPGSTLVLNTGSSVAFSALSGAVDAAGLYYDTTSTNYVRLREFTVKSAQYLLTVTDGTGGGVYTPTAQAAISATVIGGKTFVAWIGDTQYVASASSASTTVTMPAQAVNLTATYTDNSYTLTVTSGSGGGLYTNGHQVAISATAIAGKTFVEWIGDTAYVASDTAASTTVTMPAQAVNLTAIYVDTTYALTVTSGSGSGSSYTNGQQVGITADAPASGHAFVAWTGDTVYLADSNSASTTVTMPAQAVAVTATYRATEQYTTNAIPVPYSWLDGYGITNNQNAAVLLDPDGDGLTTEQEYIANTDPTSAASVLKATQNTRNVITWDARSNRIYSVYWSTNLVQGFTALSTNIVSPQSSYTNTNPDARVNHYKVKVRMQ